MTTGIWNETLKTENDMICFLTGKGKKIEITKNEFQKAIKALIENHERTFTQARADVMCFLAWGKTIKFIIENKEWGKFF